MFWIKFHLIRVDKKVKEHREWGNSLRKRLISCISAPLLCWFSVNIANASIYNMLKRQWALWTFVLVNDAPAIVSVALATRKCATVLHPSYHVIKCCQHGSRMASEGKSDADTRISYKYLKEFYEEISNVTHSTASNCRSSCAVCPASAQLETYELFFCVCACFLCFSTDA